jgi:MraZ protein
VSSHSKFRETTQHSIDDKGRLAIPPRFREVIRASGDEAIMLSYLDGCLQGYTLPEWQIVEDRILSTAYKDENMRYLRRYFVGGAKELKIDGQGRITIPAYLRNSAGIAPKSEVILIGVIDHFELWSLEAHEKDLTVFEQNLKAGMYREEIAKLGL